jgi:regulator of replication initiation timing
MPKPDTTKKTDAPLSFASPAPLVNETIREMTPEQFEALPIEQKLEVVMAQRDSLRITIGKAFEENKALRESRAELKKRVEDASESRDRSYSNRRFRILLHILQGMAPSLTIENLTKVAVKGYEVKIIQHAAGLAEVIDAEVQKRGWLGPIQPEKLPAAGDGY